MTTLSDTMSPATVADRHLAAYGEPDPIRRRGLLEAAWVPDGTLTDPPLDAATGHDQLDDLFATVQSHYPDHRFRRTTDVDVHHDFGRYGWELVGPDGAVVFDCIDTPLLVRCELELGGVPLALFTTLTTFGTPRDITLDELAIELFYPADDATEAALRAVSCG